MRWFRFYDEALNDKKVQRLAPNLFKTWVNLLCLASKGGGKIPSDDDISFELRISVSDAKQQLEDLILAGLIDIRPDGSREPHNWHERQFTSDTSVERTRKYRERLKKKPCDVTVTETVTPPEAEPDTEADTESIALTRTKSRSGGFRSLVDLGLDSRGVSPRLKEKAEGLGLPVDELTQRATAPDVKSPNAMFRHLVVERLQRTLPRADKRLLSAALTKDGSSAFGLVCQMIVEKA
jgi:hypothetical protein